MNGIPTEAIHTKQRRWHCGCGYIRIKKPPTQNRYNVCAVLLSSVDVRRPLVLGDHPPGIWTCTGYISKNDEEEEKRRRRSKGVDGAMPMPGSPIV